eukprot:15403945-Alexandrium_andersonii.AAC.1
MLTTQDHPRTTGSALSTKLEPSLSDTASTARLLIPKAREGTHGVCGLTGRTSTSGRRSQLFKG